MSTRCGFVPPYLLRILADQLEDDELVESVTGTLRTDVELRRERARADVGPRPDDARRTAYDAEHGAELPGRAVRREGDPAVGDAAVDEAYDGMGATRALFAEVYGRNSLDDRGHPLDATVHYRRNYDNAFWDGRQLVFGDGDGRIFERFTKPLDVIAHEFTHGVTQFAAGLVYQGQSGSLNESVSDVFAALTVQRLHGQSAEEASWLIGEGLFRLGIRATALRSMRAPGTAYDDPRIGRDPQPATMSGFVETDDDNGGVHVNSGIPNHAFYLAATAVGGNAWETVGPVWYATLTDGRLRADASFREFAELTVEHAARQYGEQSDQHRAVVDAWAGVEVTSTTTDAVPERAGGGARSAPGPATGRVVVVRRSGGFAGMVAERWVDTGRAAAGRRIDELLAGMDLRQVQAESPLPDEFVFAIRVDEEEVRLPEHALPPELAEVVGLVLGDEGA